ncbi:ribonuclease 3 [Nitritalea halalkaliphila LW7]|uniref:Ribonuclease 3 n=1 Tax=Nitritalea halalkaliphila LW7 TaxID=1189621 RepID=I5C2V6_9BACT|nr:ribonuclease III [Nitritalea halalkaliphila]EIM76158.1 ribonuclease 3 [Nitritalea halalkaliphila LW7]
MVGSKPLNIELYALALKHASIADEVVHGLKISNERLEYLGDAFLGAIIAEFLYQKFPYRDEGFLTETRSRMVNREALNEIARKIGLQKIIEAQQSGKNFQIHKSIYGDTLEAMVGAIYMDRGYAFTRNFVLKRIVIHFDVDDLITTTANYKSKIIEWSQKESKVIEFSTVSVTGNQRFKEFTVEILVDRTSIATGKGATKKKAEQEAAKAACESLSLL